MTNIYLKSGLVIAILLCTLGLSAKNNVLPGSGTEDEPYLIGSYEDLKLIAGDLTAVYSLTADIDAVASKTESTGWTPIGIQSAAFSGKLLGHGHTISNLYINQTANTVGLFGSVAGGTLDSIGLVNVDVNSTVPNTGALAGAIVSGVVSYCYSTGVVNGTAMVGGLIGFTSGTIINNSYSTVVVNGASAVGGLIGSCNYASQLSYSYSTGTVNVAGGIAGGLAGLMNGTITNCFTRSNVIGGTAQIGGLVGSAMGATITNAYSAGTISSTAATAKGSVGQYNPAPVMNYPASSATGLFWDTTVSGKTEAGLGTGLATADLKLQATFSAYDFSSPVWSISSTVNDGYPYLAWHPIPVNTGLVQEKLSNPFAVQQIKGGFVLKLKDFGTTSGKLEVYTAQGAKIKNIQTISESTEVTLPQGQYIGKLTSKNGTVKTFKVIVF